MPDMSRHGRSGVASPVLRHRLITGFVAAAAVWMLATSWVHRGNPDSALLWLGFGVFTGSAAIIVGSLSIGPRPLRSFGAGAWFLTMATGGVIIWLGRGAVEPDDQRGQVLVPIMLICSVGLTPLALWLMIWRPEQNWEKELRLERDSHRARMGE